MSCPWPESVRDLPVCPKRDLPIPYIAEIDPATGIGHFTVLDPQRARECLEYRLCAMCGKPMGGEVAFLTDKVSLQPGGYTIEPPVHEQCAVDAAAGLCPFVSRQRVPRRPVGDGLSLVGTGRATITQVGRTVAKRPVVMAITETYQAAMTPNDDGGLSMIYLPGPAVRVRRYHWDRDGRLAEVLPAPPATPVIRSQPRRKQPRRKR